MMKSMVFDTLISVILDWAVNWCSYKTASQVYAKTLKNKITKNVLFSDIVIPLFTLSFEIHQGVKDSLDTCTKLNKLLITDIDVGSQKYFISVIGKQFNDSETV